MNRLDKVIEASQRVVAARAQLEIARGVLKAAEFALSVLCSGPSTGAVAFVDDRALPARQVTDVDSIARGRPAWHGRRRRSWRPPIGYVGYPLHAAHGKAESYTHHGCRCRACVIAYNARPSCPKQRPVPPE